MRLTKHRHKTSMPMNMTPMIDIVFLLIIFFMTVSQVSEINKERLELPKEKGTEEQEPTRITINVDQDGKVVVSGRQFSVTELVTLVGDEFAAVGHDSARLTIMLRADRRGNSRTVNQIVAALSRLGVTRVNIGVQPEG